MAIGNPLSNLFGRSPITPIQRHMKKVHACSTELTAFFDAVIANDWQTGESQQQKIAKLEHDADDLKKNIRLHLPKSLFMPMPRTDLLELVSMQDKIANKSKDIAGIMLGRKMSIPASMADSMRKYVATAIATANGANNAIQELDELLETGFAGYAIEIVEKLIKELDELEHKNDQLQVQVRAELFELEADMPPVDVMFLYKVIDGIGELADRAQKVGSRLQLLLAR
jgi:hypothetical protein